MSEDAGSCRNGRPQISPQAGHLTGPSQSFNRHTPEDAGRRRKQCLRSIGEAGGASHKGLAFSSEFLFNRVDQTIISAPPRRLDLLRDQDEQGSATPFKIRKEKFVLLKKKSKKRKKAEDERLAYNAVEFARLIGKSERHVREEIYRGKLRALKKCGAWLISREAGDEYRGEAPQKTKTPDQADDSATAS